MESPFKDFGNRWVGITLSIISIIILIIMASFSIKIAKINAAGCVHIDGGPCPLIGHIPLDSYIGAALLATIFILGIKISLKSVASEKMRKEQGDKSKMLVKSLKGDEKKAYELIMESQGAVFQSELVEKMGCSKVKVSRILDKLEGKNLIERRRCGLANMVLMKYR